MKKTFVIFVLALLISSFVLAAAQETPQGFDAFENDSVVQGVQKIQETVEERRWEYLSAQWQEILLKNKLISALDKTFRQFNFVFFFLFGQDYSLSLTLFFVFLSWIFFLSMFEKIIKDFSTFSSGPAFVIALCLTIILAQFHFHSFLATLLFKVIFFRQGLWGWLALFIFIILYLVLLIFAQRIIWQVGRAFKKSKEEKEKWDEKFERQLFHKRVEGIEKAFGTIEEGMRK